MSVPRKLTEVQKLPRPILQPAEVDSPHLRKAPVSRVERLVRGEAGAKSRSNSQKSLFWKKIPLRLSELEKRNQCLVSKC